MLFQGFVAGQESMPKLGSISLDDGLSQSTVYAIEQDKFGFMWFGTQDGLNRYDGYNIEVFKHTPGDTNTVADITILSLCCDSDSNLWIGTMRNGISIYSTDDSKFTHLQHIPDDSTSLSDNFVNRIYEDKLGNIWIGTFNKGLNVISTATNKLYRIKLPGQGMKDNDHLEIWKFIEDNDGNLWIGTGWGVLELVDRKKGTFTHFTDSNNRSIIPGIAINSICEDIKGNLIIGLMDGGFNILNPDTREVVNFMPKPEEHGLAEGTSVNNTTVTSVYPDSNNIFWIGTVGGGSNRYDANTGKFIYFSTRDGLANDIIYSVLDGLQGNEFTQGAYAKSKSGKLYFGGLDEFNYFNPATIKSNKFVPQYISEILKFSMNR